MSEYFTHIKSTASGILYLKSFIAVCLILSFLLNAAEEKPHCDFSFFANKGVPVVWTNELPVSELDHVFILGEGLGGGSVYRVEARTDNSERIFKVYKNPELMKEDMLRLEVLQELLADIANPPFSWVTMKHESTWHDSTAEISLSTGKTVRQVLDSPDTPEKIRSHIRSLYEERFQKLVQLIKQKNPNASTGSFFEDMLESPLNRRHSIQIPTKEHRRVFLWLHEGNILIEPSSLDMKIIDPD